MDYPKEIIINENAAELIICWSFHDICNFKCSYCPSCNHEGKVRPADIETLYSFVDKVHGHYISGLGLKNVQFSFTGGEPPLCKYFGELCKHIFDKGMTVGMTSNGSPKTDFWNNTIQYFDWLCLSFHPEKVDEAHFYEVFKLIHDKKDVILPTIRLMMHPDEKLWDKCIQIRDKIKDSFPNWAFDYVKIQNDFGTDITPVEYTDPAQLEFFKANSFEENISNPDLVRFSKHPHSFDVIYESGKREFLRPNYLVNQDMVNFKGWECKAGLRSLFIEKDGTIYSASCFLNRSTLGNVSSPESVKFPSKPVICEHGVCNCGTNIMIEKKSI